MIFSRLKHVVDLFGNRVPGQVIIQMTDKCNALCPQCGMRRTADYQRTELEVDDMKRVIDKAVENKVEAMSFTGGEPMLNVDRLVSLLKYAGDAGIKYTRTGTNGYLFRYRNNEDEFRTRISKIAEKLAATSVRNFWISIDSAEPHVHEEMRGFTNLIEGIRRAVPIFHEFGIYPSANLGINRNVGGKQTQYFYKEPRHQDDAYFDLFYSEFRSSFQRFYEFVIDLGFTTVNTCYPMSVQNNGNENLSSVYTATSRDLVVNFSDGEREKLFQALMDTVPEYRDQIRIFTPLSSLYALVKQYQGVHTSNYPCRGGIDFFFIDSKDGNTYPCGFRGNESFGKYEDLDLDKIDRKAVCHKCDWECFRDPSALFGPFLEGAMSPVQLYRKFYKDREYFALWREDLKYYEACQLFNGRQAPDYLSLAKFSANQTV